MRVRSLGQEDPLEEAWHCRRSSQHRDWALVCCIGGSFVFFFSFLLRSYLEVRIWIKRLMYIRLPYILNWPKSLFRLFHQMLYKNPNELFGYPSTYEKKWQPSPVFFPGESHGQRSLEGYSPWDRRESATVERLTPYHCILYRFPAGISFFK